MSSSKIFKSDSLFTPTTLVQRSIDIAAENVADVAALDAGDQYLAETNGSPELREPESDDRRADRVVSRSPDPPPDPGPDLQALRDEAYAQGMADMGQQQQAQLQAAIGAFAAICQKLDNQRRAILERSRGDMINLIITVTQVILGQELSTSRNVIAATLQKALEQAIDSEEYYVTLHPDGLACAEEKAPEIIDAIRGLERLVFKTDSTITRGGCLLESAACAADATIETQIEGLREFLEEHPSILPPPEQE